MKLYAVNMNQGFGAKLPAGVKRSFLSEVLNNLPSNLDMTEWERHTVVNYAKSSAFILYRAARRHGLRLKRHILMDEDGRCRVVNWREARDLIDSGAAELAYGTVALHDPGQSQENPDPFDDFISSLSDAAVPGMAEACRDYIKYWGSGGGSYAIELAVYECCTTDRPKKLAGTLYKRLRMEGLERAEARSLVQCMFEDANQELNSMQQRPA